MLLQVNFIWFLFNNFFFSFLIYLSFNLLIPQLEFWESLLDFHLELWLDDNVL